MKAEPIASPVPPWRFPPETLLLGCDEVHVWRATLDQPPSQILRFLNNLAVDERARAERLRFKRDRERFIVARGVLRAILGFYSNRAPECLSFCYSSFGKPALAGESDRGAIRFSLSHSHGVALYAVTRRREVGIDLERIRFDLAVVEIAERFFSRREQAMLRALPTELQREAFYRCWTRKEAYIKARGEGLSLPLDQFDVSLAPGEPAAILGTQHDPSEASRWSLRELTAAPGYFAALAVEGHGWGLTCWQWPDPRP
jgi:4'-phosphopantetheinyl transferase